MAEVAVVTTGLLCVEGACALVPAAVAVAEVGIAAAIAAPFALGVGLGVGLMAAGAALVEDWKK